MLHAQKKFVMVNINFKLNPKCPHIFCKKLKFIWQLQLSFQLIGYKIKTTGYLHVSCDTIII